jgi:hypothetical protein
VPLWEEGIGTQISRESSGITTTEGEVMSRTAEASVGGMGAAPIPSKTSKRNNLLKIAMKILARITKSLVVAACRASEGAEVE